MKKKAKEIKKKNLISNIQSLISDHRGITLIALVITIVLMLILVAVTINATIDGSLFGYATNAKIITELKELQEQLTDYQYISNTKVSRGKINDVLEIDSPYNNSLEIEDGKLVYFKGVWSQHEIEMLEEIGINQASYDIYNQNNNIIYYIANENTIAKFEGLTNMGTLEQFRDLANGNNFSYDEARIIEDIKLNEGKYTVTSEGITFAEDASQWTAIGSNFTKILDGQGHIISGLKGTQGLFSNVNALATVKNLGIKNSSFIGTETVGVFAKYNYGTIENCFNEAIVDSNRIGCICWWNSRIELQWKYNKKLI